MRAYCCQLDIAWEDKPANYAKVRVLLQKARVEPGSLVVLPEMFSTGFSMETGRVCEPMPSPTERFVSELATELRSCVVAGVVNPGPDGRPRNQAVAFAPGGQLLARYSKIHPFSLGGESACYAAGCEVLAFTWGDFQVAPFVCYDLRFPEVFRHAVGQGTEVFVVIANWPIKREGHWVTLLQARAIENQAYVVGVNRAGTDPKFTYPGRSLIVDPHGQVLTDVGAAEGVGQAELDPAIVRSWRADFPALRDMHWQASGGAA